MRRCRLTPSHELRFAKIVADPPHEGEGKGAQCRKCLTPVNTMAMPCCVGGGDDVVVAHRAARLDDGGGAGFDGGQQAVGEGEEGVGGDDRALGQRFGKAGRLGRVERLAGGDARGIDPAHLAGADADGGAVPDVDDGVGLDVLGDAEGEFQVGHLGRRRRAPGHHLQLEVVDHGIVPALDEQAAGDGFDRRARRARVGQAAGDQQAQVLLRRDDCGCLVGRIGRDDHLGEGFDDLLGGFGVERAVHGDDAAEGRDRVAGERLGIGCLQRRRLRRRRTGWRA